MVVIANERREWPNHTTLDTSRGSDLTQNLIPTILHVVTENDPVLRC